MLLSEALRQADGVMLAKWGEHENLVDNDAFWADVFTAYRGADLALPIEANQFTTRDLADVTICPPGECGQCCTQYKRVQITPRDVERASEGAGVDLTPHLRTEEEGTFLKVEGGCPLLVENRCSIYRFRPDCCYFHPIQWGHNYNEKGEKIDPRLYVRVECLPVVRAIRAVMERVVRLNPGSVLLPTLAVRKGGDNGR
jgi:Fe-S-cluster containining protein